MFDSVKASTLSAGNGRLPQSCDEGLPQLMRCRRLSFRDRNARQVSQIAYEDHSWASDRPIPVGCS